MPDNKSESTVLPESLGQYVRFGGLALAGLYAVGVLIVNLDLAKYGLFHVGLARPEYVMSGCLWAVLAGASAWAGHILWEQASGWRKALLPLVATRYRGGVG